MKIAELIKHRALSERLALEIYRYSGKFLPDRLRIPLKRLIDRTDPQANQKWASMGTLTRKLAHTPYRVRLNMQHWHQRWTYVKGSYPEPHIHAMISALLQEGDLFIDIGANIGLHAILGAYQVGSAGRCIAVEPNPYSVQNLRETIATNHIEHIEVFGVALGMTEGEVILHDCAGENVGSTIRGGDAAGSNDCHVPLLRGDSLFANIAPDTKGLCKIDVEGYELQVLRGMNQFIEHHPGMSYIIEVTADWLQSLGDSAEALFALFLERGFAAYLLTPETAQPRQIQAPQAVQQYDVLFTRQKLIK